jgi:hypothetical protein
MEWTHASAEPAVVMLLAIARQTAFCTDSASLIDIGLPQGDVPLALLTFNVGVEIGQLAFITMVLSVIRVAEIWTAA